MKRLIFTLACISSLIVVSMYAQDFAYTYKDKTLNYTILDEDACTVKVKGGVENGDGSKRGNYVEGDLVIPSVVYDETGKEYTVVEIGACAFWVNDKLTSVVIPSTVTSIGNQAFALSHSLVTVDIPNTITYIGVEAFNACFKLRNIEIPNMLTEISTCTFTSCMNLKNVTIPNTVTSIGENAFLGTGMTSVTIPPSVKKIYEGAFDMTPINTVNIGCGLEHMEWTFNEDEPISVLNITALTPPSPVEEDGNFFALYSDSRLNVMPGVEEEYKTSAYQWSKFKNVGTLVVPEEVIISRESVFGDNEEKVQLVATVLPEDVTVKDIFWMTTNPKVATVDNHGLVTFAPGVHSGDECSIQAYTIYSSEPAAEYNVSFKAATSCEQVDDFQQSRVICDLYGRIMNVSEESLTQGIYIINDGHEIVKKYVSGR